MTMGTRINVDSGRPLESRAQYSRALRVNERVVQSGTTAIDLDGNILGKDIRTQIAAVLDIARESMAAANGHFRNIVRARLFVVGRENLGPADETFRSAFKGQNLAVTVIPVSRLARPTQLVEIELEAVDEDITPRAPLLPVDQHWLPGGQSCGMQIGNKILLSGGTCARNSIETQAKQSVRSITTLIEQAGAAASDLVSLRVFITNIGDRKRALDALSAELGNVTPVITLLAIPPLQDDDARILIEAEGIIGAGDSGQTTPHPQHPGFAATLSIEEHVYLSNIEYLTDDGQVEVPNDWAGQRNGCTIGLEKTLKQIGASLDDVIVRRYYTAVDAEMNSDYGDGLSWFANTRPAALGCRIAANSRPEVVLSLEAHAVRGAGQNIEWRKLPNA
jgi:enamine deaminase RidA (YjgF/YER057c/UK114 family)